IAFATCRTSTASATSTTIRFGSARISATSSIAWWLGPPGLDTPGMKPMIRTGSRGNAIALMIWSSGRRVANTPKVCTNGMNPSRASAPAMPIMLASAIPAWMNRSGKASANRSISHCLVRSPDRQTMSSRSFASATSAWPYGFRTVGYGGCRRSAMVALQQFGLGPGGEVRRQLDEVAVRVRRKTAQAVAGRSTAYQNGRFAAVISFGERSAHCAGVVAVDVRGGPAEGLPLRGDRLDRGDGVDRAVHLGVVGVQQDGQAGEPVVGGEHGGLPDLALLEFAVADHGEHAPVAVLQPVGQGEADRGRQALAERAADVVRDRRALGADGLDRRAVLAVGRRGVLVEDAEFGGRREDCDHVVAGRADEAVAARPHDREERGHLLRARQRLAQVAESLRLDHADGAQPDGGGQARRVWHGPVRAGIGNAGHGVARAGMISRPLRAATDSTVSMSGGMVISASACWKSSRAPPGPVMVRNRQSAVPFR